MKSLFFQNGHKIHFSPNNQNFIQTSSNLDSKKYILQKIPIEQFQYQDNYIESNFYFSRQNNLISYFNCWKQTENVSIEKPIEKTNKEPTTVKKNKKTMLDIMKRKTKVIDNDSILNPPSKKKMVQEIQKNNQNFIVKDFIYVQLEYFSEIDIPNDFSSCRDLIVIVYLLGKMIQQKTGCLPCLIPVKNEQNDRIKFYKKGMSIEVELYNLMTYLFGQKQSQYLSQWSEILSKSILKAQINHDHHLIGQLMQNAILQYLQVELFSIFLTAESGKQPKMNVQSVKIVVQTSTMHLQESDIQIPLQEYKIQYLLKSQNDRQITLTHELFEEYVLHGKKNDLIVKWLYHLSN